MQEHPETVFNQRGERELTLSRSALEMLAAFESLLVFLVQPASAAVRCAPLLPPVLSLSALLCRTSQQHSLLLPAAHCARTAAQMVAGSWGPRPAAAAWSC